jgi:hypothetical protein
MGELQLPYELPLLAIGFFAVMLMSAVFAISGDRRSGGGWGWTTLLVFTGVGLLVAAAFTGPN